MYKELKCVAVKGEGTFLREIKESTRSQLKDVRSFVRISTCQRVEVYSDEDMPSLENLDGVSFPESMVNLVEVMSGVDSGLFGEIEVSLQVKKSLMQAKEKGHLSHSLESIFIAAFEISDRIREEFGLKNSWVAAVIKVILRDDQVFIFGDGSLAKSLIKRLSEEGVQILDRPEKADVAVILKKGFKLPRKNVRVVNLTEERLADDEVTIEQFFSSPGVAILASIRREIRVEVSKLSGGSELSVL